MRIVLALLLLCTSCSNFINRMHRELDQGNPPVEQYSQRSNDKFDLYRRPVGSNNAISTNDKQYVAPKVQRYYRAEEAAQKRYTADDLTDNVGDGSLWAGHDGANYLFSANKVRRPGDIVIVNILGKLKNEITMELKRSFPETMRPTTAAPAAAAAANTAEGADEQAGSDDTGEESEGSKVYDRVSGVIVEEINSDHFLLRGQKSVLYKGKKRMIEIRAMIAKRDIGDNDSVDSDRFLESSIQVLR